MTIKLKKIYITITITTIITIKRFTLVPYLIYSIYYKIWILAVRIDKSKLSICNLNRVRWCRPILRHHKKVPIKTWKSLFIHFGCLVQHNYIDCKHHDDDVRQGNIVPIYNMTDAICLNLVGMEARLHNQTYRESKDDDNSVEDDWR